jgi:MFS family permease
MYGSDYSKIFRDLTDADLEQVREAAEAQYNALLNEDGKTTMLLSEHYVSDGNSSLQRGSDAAVKQPSIVDTITDELHKSQTMNNVEEECSCSSPGTWLVALGFLQMLMSSGIVWGWAALQAVLIDDGVYADKCRKPFPPVTALGDDATTCNNQLDALHLVFVAGSVGVYISNLPFGFSLDHLGPRITAIAASLTMLAGVLAMAFDEYALGYFLLGLAGPGVQISAFHVYDRFPKWKGRLMQGATACFDAGSVVFLIFLQLHDAYGLTHLELFRWFTIVPVFILISSAVFWSRARPIIINDVPDSDTKELLDQAEKASIRRDLTGVPFLFLTAFAAIHSLRLNYALQIVGDQLSLEYRHNPAEASTLANAFNFMLPFGFVIVPIAGFLLDFKGTKPALTLGNVMGLIYGVIFVWLLSEPGFAYASFVCIAMSRQLVFGSAFTCTAKWYKKERFGRYVAVQKTITAIVGLGQYLMSYLAIYQFSHSYYETNIIMLALMLPLFAVHFLNLPKDGGM